MRPSLRTVLVLCAAVSAGCVSDRIYRPKQSVFEEKLRTRDFDRTQIGVAKVEWPYTLAFVEFNDQGRMFERDQLTRALAAIGTVTGARRDPSAAAPIVVVFVHGWKNNASDGSGNVWGFRQTLAGLSAQQGAPVLGIYVGWRGATVSAPFLKEFTFFDRHRKSQSVPEGEMIDALRRMVQAAKANPDVRLVLIGHSFGGAVLETAITPQLRDAIAAAQQEARPEQRRVKWPADLIVLLNEAQEAERSYPLIEEMHRAMAPRIPCSQVDDNNPYTRPAVMSISSRADQATRAFFPGAQLIARPFTGPAYKGADPLGVGTRRLYYSTTAHISTLRSHRIGRRSDPDVQAALGVCRFPVLQSEISMFEEDHEYLLVEDPETVNRTPYWVMWMPRDIVPDHSTIFTQVFRDFVVSLIGVATLLPPHDMLLEAAR